MNDRTNRLATLFRILDADASGGSGGPPPRDGLDDLLRAWHDENADAARASRERTLRAIAEDRGVAQRPSALTAPRRHPLVAVGSLSLRFLRSRPLRAAACLAAAALLATMILVPTTGTANASVVQVADGGELTAFAVEDDAPGAERDRLGPCALEHTDVSAEVSGPITRVTVRQRYANPFHRKIEAVYTFPLSHRAAVDAMRIVVRSPDGSERVVDGEVRERGLARRMYEEAKRTGLVASLLEQERTNVFTQSVANIEPGAAVTVEISYVEFLERVEGEYRFAFPMVVAPRYVPGAPRVSGLELPEGLRPRAGLVLLGPADVAVATPNATLSDDALRTALAGAIAVATPSPEWMERPASGLGQPITFGVTYANGSREVGQFFVDAHLGELNGRWFVTRRVASGGGFAPDTDRVPDASRITPMPVRPSERAGHDVSIAVTIDGGGVSIRDLASELHEVTERPGERPNTTTVALTAKTTIPNRDFVLSWRATPKAAEGSAAVATGALAHRRMADDETAGGYLAMVIEPPARAAAHEMLDREIVFLIDTSGSMSGFPIEKSKELMTRALDAMRPEDTFNVITFAGSTTTLWPSPRQATAENRSLARAFVEAPSGSGGTEMLPALQAALGVGGGVGGDAGRRGLSVRELANLPADGRAVIVSVEARAVDPAAGLLHDTAGGPSLRARFEVSMPAGGSRPLELSGRWITATGERVLVVETARFEPEPSRRQRALVFLTDGLIGNDGEIIDFVRRASRSTRVFAFGIGNSVNRALIDGVARAGRGAAEFVTLPADADAAIARLARRMSTPVLADIEVSFNGIAVSDTHPPLDAIPDLLDERPIVLVGRFTDATAGSVTIRGRTAAGPWERTMPLDLRGAKADHASIASLWARERADALLATHDTRGEAIAALPAPLRAEVVRLGERYRIMTPLTSFVAIERSRVTVGGAPMLVQIPIELPEGMSWKGLFGEGVGPARIASQPDLADPVRSQRRTAAVAKIAERSLFAEGVDDSDAVALFFDHSEPAMAAPLDDGVDNLGDAQFPWQSGRGERWYFGRDVSDPAEPTGGLTGIDFLSAGGFGGGGGGGEGGAGTDTNGGRSDGATVRFGWEAKSAESVKELEEMVESRAVGRGATTAAPAIGKARVVPQPASGQPPAAPPAAAPPPPPAPRPAAGPAKPAGPARLAGDPREEAAPGAEQPAPVDVATSGDKSGSSGEPDNAAILAFTESAVTDAIRARLNAPATLGVVDAELATAVDELARRVGAPVAVDWAALAEAKITAASRITLVPSDRPVATALTESLGALVPEDSAFAPAMRVEMGVITLTLERREPPSRQLVVEDSAISDAGPGGTGLAKNGDVQTGAVPPPPAAMADPTTASAPTPAAVPDQPKAAADAAADPSSRAPSSTPTKAKEAPRLRLDEAARATLARRLERSLIVIGLAAAIDEPSAAEIARTGDPAIEPDNAGRVLVAISVDSSEPRAFTETVARLRDAGVAVEATQPSVRLVIARVALRDLVRVALLPGLRRIESIRAAADPS